MYGESVTLKMILDAMAESQNKIVSVGTHHYVQLSASKELEEYPSDKLSQLELLAPIGAKVPANCEIAWKRKCKNLKAFLNTYGQTETGMLTINRCSNALGRVMPGVELKVCTGEILSLQKIS